MIAPRRISIAQPTARQRQPARVLRVAPLDGATGVLRDAPVLARFDQPILEELLTPGSFTVRDASGEVPARLLLSPDGLVAIWQADRRLRSCCEHEVTILVADARFDSDAAGYRGRFTTGSLTREEL